MITKEELDALVRKEFTDKVTRKEWYKKKNNLDEQYQPEYVAPNKLIWVKSTGYVITADEDLAYFCWKCGCSLTVHQDWNDGSPTCCFWLPETEEEYQNNLKESAEWWKEVMEDN